MALGYSLNGMTANKRSNQNEIERICKKYQQDLNTLNKTLTNRQGKFIQWLSSQIKELYKNKNDAISKTLLNAALTINNPKLVEDLLKTEINPQIVREAFNKKELKNEILKNLLLSFLDKNATAIKSDLSNTTDTSTKPEPIIKLDSNFSEKDFLAEIEHKLNPPQPRPFWSQAYTRTEFDRLNLKISGYNPDAIFSKSNIELFGKWLNIAANNKVNIPPALKTLFTQSLKELFASRPSYKHFSMENPNIPAAEMAKLVPVIEKLLQVFNNLLSNLKALNNNPLFSTEDYKNKDDDIKTIENEITLINQELSKIQDKQTNF